MGGQPIELGRVHGFMIIALPKEKERVTYGVRTGKLRTPGNYWPNVFDQFGTQEEAERWVARVLVPSLKVSE